MALLSFVQDNMDKINWKELSQNKNASAHFLEQHIDKIDWGVLSENSSEGAIHLLEQHPEQIAEQNQDKINWLRLSANPSIFEKDWKPILK